MEWSKKGSEKFLLANLQKWTFCNRPSNCGNTLKQFQPNKSGNTSYGTGNDSWYGKIEIDLQKVMGNPQPSTIFFFFLDRCAVHRLNVGWRGIIRSCLSRLRYSQTSLERVQDNKTIWAVKPARILLSVKWVVGSPLAT